jgi:spore cortex formation protein SpoVR/YcgB (stage V sporulation)
VLEKIQIKYGFEYFGIRNNFTHWKFSKSMLEFELKIKESLGFEIQ